MRGWILLPALERTNGTCSLRYTAVLCPLPWLTGSGPALFSRRSHLAARCGNTSLGLLRHLIAGYCCGLSCLGGAPPLRQVRPGRKPIDDRNGEAASIR